MKRHDTQHSSQVLGLSVLSVEPYGMKLHLCSKTLKPLSTFSALGRAVWDETSGTGPHSISSAQLSVLSVEPYGMKPLDEGEAFRAGKLSVLSVEPYGMKRPGNRGPDTPPDSFSALGRAVWDETTERLSNAIAHPHFQCSRSSRMG